MSNEAAVLNYGETATFKPVEFDGFRILSELWEQIHNPCFKGLAFETFRNQAGLNSFSLTQMRTLLANPNIKRLKS